MARKPPFDTVRNDAAIIRRVTNGERPDRLDPCHPVAWGIITRCWVQEAEHRPSTRDVLKSMRHFTSSIVQPSEVVGSAPNDGVQVYVGTVEEKQRYEQAKARVYMMQGGVPQSARVSILSSLIVKMSIDCAFFLRSHPHLLSLNQRLYYRLLQSAAEVGYQPKMRS